MQGLDSVDETSADIDSGPIPVDGTSGTAHPGQAGGAPDGETLKEQVLEVLKEVHDPELGVNIVDLGLVYGVEIDGGTVHITYTLTTMGCPIGPRGRHLRGERGDGPAPGVDPRDDVRRGQGGPGILLTVEHLDVTLLHPIDGGHGACTSGPVSGIVFRPWTSE